MTRRILILLLCLVVLPLPSLAQCVLPAVVQDENRAGTVLRSMMGWWMTQRGKTAGTRWVDIIRGRVGTLTAMTAPGTATSGWGLTTTRPGGFGELRFDGTGDEVGLGNLTLASTPGKAGCAWVYPTAFANFAAIYRHSDNFSMRYNTAGHYSDQTYNSIATASSTFTFSTTALPLNTWTHVCAVQFYTTSIQVAYYLNGRLDKLTDSALTDTGGLIGFAGSRTAKIGSDPDAAGRTWTGRIDDVMVWQRALSAGEVNFLYKDSKRGHPTMLCSNPLLEVVRGPTVVTGRPRLYVY